MDCSSADVPKHPRPASRMHVKLMPSPGVRAARALIAAVLLPAVVMLAACGAGGASDAERTPPRAPAETRERAVGAADGVTAAAERPRVIVLGDSLTTGLGLPEEEAFPARLQAMVDEAGYAHEVVAAGNSGDTSAAGLRRLEWSFDGDVRVLILALGANDGLRGLPVEGMKTNLATILEGARARGARVLLTGMEAPPNFGSIYTNEFRAAFRDLAEEYDVAFVPFLLDGVAGHPELNQDDGIHPNAEGAALVAELLWPALEPLLEDGGAP